MSNRKKPSFVTETAEVSAAALEKLGQSGPSDVDVAGVRDMGMQLASMDAALAALAAASDQISTRRRELATKLLPERMMELRIPSIGIPMDREAWLRQGAAALAAASAMLEDPSPELLDSVKVPEAPVLRLDDFVSANIAKDWDPERRQRAFDWLVASSNEGLIKVQVRALFGRGQRKLLDKALAAFRKALGASADDVPVEVDESVPHSTLAAFVRTEMEAGREVPLETLGATVGKIAKLTRARK